MADWSVGRWINQWLISRLVGELSVWSIAVMIGWLVDLLAG